ncbi:kinase-like domain-containing protein [Gigaspora margarita]|uniref:Kinase-like domain-containing protein n=1 Tax=Gigaspora margarita TaxID=4874 RepID=A0A8H4B453_GIGMA|nr:kinase-like domain-containing protein [Gigaspora margarita]
MPSLLEEWFEQAISEKHINYIEYNKFTDRKRIGEKVFKYEWKVIELTVTVALRCLKVDRSIDEQIIRDLIDELKLWRRGSNHSNIISFYGVTKDSDGLQWTDKLLIAKGIALGLLYLHDNNFIHGALHPGNILIHEKQPKIADLPSMLMNKMTLDVDLIGVMEYTDPQYMLGAIDNPNMKSNVYSLGLILWQISSGKPPFQNIKSDMSETKFLVMIYRGKREDPIEVIG